MTGTIKLEVTGKSISFKDQGNIFLFSTLLGVHVFLKSSFINFHFLSLVRSFIYDVM